MSKTLVNIITEDNPIPAYLFIQEMYEEGDRLMYISAKDTEDDLDALSELFNVPATLIDEIVLKTIWTSSLLRGFAEWCLLGLTSILFIM